MTLHASILCWSIPSRTSGVRKVLLFCFVLFFINVHMPTAYLLLVGVVAFSECGNWYGENITRFCVSFISV